MVYLFSYAPVVKVHGGWKVYHTTNGFGQPATVKAPIYSADLPMYVPVDWLIDNTPLQDPLWWWADVWGVRSPFTEAAMWRPRGTNTPAVTSSHPRPTDSPASHANNNSAHRHNVVTP